MSVVTKIKQYINKIDSLTLFQTLLNGSKDGYHTGINENTNIIRIEHHYEKKNDDSDTKRAFICSQNNQELNTFIKYIRQELYMEAQEVFVPAANYRIFFDIDLKLKKGNELDMLKNYFIDSKSLSQTLSQFLNELLDLILCIYYESNTEKMEHAYDTRNRQVSETEFKISMHWYSNLFVKSIYHVNDVVKNMKSLINEELQHYKPKKKFFNLTNTKDNEKMFILLEYLNKDSITNLQPYKSNGSLSMTGGYKCNYCNEIGEDDSFGIRDDTFVCIRKYQQLGASDIFVDFEISQSVKQFIGVADDEFTQRVRDNLKNQNFVEGFDISGIRKGNFLDIKRFNSSFCSVCNRNHDNDNTLMIMLYDDTKAASWKCRRSDSKAICFYKEQIVNDNDSFLNSEICKRISNLSNIDIAYVETAMKDKDIIGSDWCDKYVTQIQDNNHQINNTRNWIKFTKLLNQITFPDSITAVMYVALHIHKYYILFDKQIWKRYGMTGNDTESGSDNSLKDIIIKYGHGEEIKLCP
jgi:hypothetical protein